MPIIAKAQNREGGFQPCPPGPHAAVCVDVVDLGLQDNKFQPGKQQHKIRIVWQVDERMDDGRPYIASRMFTLSLDQKSALRAVLESWRGRPFTAEELNGWDVESVVGVPCMINVVESKAEDGKTYSNVRDVTRLLKSVPAPVPDPTYTRVKDRPAA